MMYSLLTNTTRFSLQLNKTGPSRGIVVLLPFYHTSPQIRWRWLKGDLSFIVLLLFCTASYAPHKCNSFTSPPLCIRYYASLQFREEDQRMTDYLKQVTCCYLSIYLSSFSKIESFVWYHTWLSSEYIPSNDTMNYYYYYYFYHYYVYYSLFSNYISTTTTTLILVDLIS